ncbi:TonB-dependent receptor (plasmid) [Paracoccus liaowanqingii]|uniref:TonB-dependent receptor n=1 Tax=Paracoccus liaowanqingii TaxID=2560053 RepID=A0A4Y5SS17_9RHOB|nr:TonB-dependent receptor plug domain-containing protein [Paracoccus liaowanqingii]QDA36261.1 TonB-dependent receptor [Paracoccus liaowanqingii]
MSKSPLAAVLLGSSLLPGHALAQAILLDPIVLSVVDDPSGQIAVSEAQIRDARTGTLEDLFRAEPSVTVGGGIAIAERVFVNGIDEQQLAVSVDGAAQNNRMFHHTGTNIIDPNLLKAARVDPGVAPADAGFAALAGSLAYETKSAPDLLEPGRRFGGQATTGLAGNGDTATGALALYGQQGPVDVLVYGKRATGEAYTDGDGAVVPRTGADMTSFALKLGTQMGDWRAELGAIGFKDDALRPYRANLGGVFGGRPTPETRRYALDQNSQTLTLRRTGTDGLLNPEIRLSRSESALDTFDLATAETPAPDFNTGVADTVSLVVQNRFQLGGAEVTAGLDTARSRGRYEGQYDGSVLAFREDRTNTGLFVQTRGRHGPIDYSAGLRYDQSRFTGVGGQAVDTDGASVNAAITWHVTDTLSLNAGASSVFGGTQLASVYELDDFSAPDAYDALGATRGQNRVLGAEWTQGGTTLGAEIFRTRLGDVRKGLTARDLESEGFRLSARQDWRGGFAALRYSDTEVTLDGRGASSFDVRELGTIPGAMLTLEARHEVRAGLTLGGIVQHAIEEETRAADTDSDWPGYTVVDIFAEYEPEAFDNVTFRAEVTNLFDRTYVDRASYGSDYAEVVGQREPGRSIAATAVLRF